MRTTILASLTMACAVTGAVMGTTTASGQTTTWEGHTYQAIWYRDVVGREPTLSIGWWGDALPADHATALGGHIVTITSAEEEEAVRGLWAEVVTAWAGMPQESFLETVLDVIHQDRSTTPLTVIWSTGERSTYFHELLENQEDHWQLYIGSSPMQVAASDQAFREAKPLYILEIDPPIGPVDTDGDGLTDDQEKNTRHSYSFVQVPDPVILGVGGGWHYQQIVDDAITRGGHLVEVSGSQELVEIIDILQPWLVGPSSNYLSVTPTSVDGVCIRTGSGQKNHYLSGDCGIYYSTYILEIENSTDANNPDTDSDGLNDGQEVLTYHTDPLNSDSDGDQLFDGIEINTTKTNPLAADTDADGLDDYVEVATHKTNPLLADTDGDGFDDKLEVDKGTDPLSPASLPVVQLEVFPAIEVTMATKAGENYQLQVSLNLQTWAPLGDVFAGTGQPYSRFIAAREQASFLRAVIIQ